MTNYRNQQKRILKASCIIVKVEIEFEYISIKFNEETAKLEKSVKYKEYNGFTSW